MLLCVCITLILYMERSGSTVQQLAVSGCEPGMCHFNARGNGPNTPSPFNTALTFHTGELIGHGGPQNTFINSGYQPLHIMYNTKEGNERTNMCIVIPSGTLYKTIAVRAAPLRLGIASCCSRRYLRADFHTVGSPRSSAFTSGPPEKIK